MAVIVIWETSEHFYKCPIPIQWSYYIKKSGNPERINKSEITVYACLYTVRFILLWQKCFDVVICICIAFMRIRAFKNVLSDKKHHNILLLLMPLEQNIQVCFTCLHALKNIAKSVLMSRFFIYNDPYESFVEGIHSVSILCTE